MLETRSLLTGSFELIKKKNVLAFFFSILFSTGMTLFLSDPSFTKIQNSVLFLLFLAISLWVTEAIPPFSVSILIVGFLVLVMGKSEAHDAIQYLQTWSDSVIWLFLGGFFLAEAMKKTKLDLMLLKAVLPKFGNNPVHVLWGLMLVTALMSMLMSNTATTAMMIATISPLFTRLNKESNLAKALLLGIPAAASVGGIGTIIGSAPNAIAVGALEKLGYPISFLEWMIAGTPLALVLLLIFWYVLVKKYHIKQEDNLNFDFLAQAPSTHTNRVESLHKAIVLIILAITLFCWLTSKWIGIPVAAASGIPIVGLTMLGVLDAKDIRQLPWDTLMLVAGGLALGLAIEEQQIATHFVEKISHIQLTFMCLLFVFAFITVILSNFMSNTAATTILIPMGVSLLTMVGGDVNPMVLPLVIGLSASCALFLPVSTPPNAIAFSTGLIQQSEFRLGGIVIGLLGPILSIAWILVVIHFF
ncbi:DASS family sodium-coupled anion symporter [Actinobacillus porcinus]|uniref:SLC13 family permease n=1 Tax=Actinobacillus porcinus TaxID=51048 RepID=UPI0023F0BBE1|nr:DASS family sodium-coupled anion symporter [Actinobacillus porcinus]MDD7546113.1 DASS family sodium-coupled anion symporter [Actinobacillus porcinus]MDY5847537.1 DASS family sodium-coupled anion symporter [Actinobacillus porcinus]